MPTYYKRNVNPTNNNWNQADNWSTVSSTSSTNTGTFPILGDSVIFDSNSTQLLVNVPSACSSIDFSTYTNTINMSSQINVSGNVTLGSGMSITGIARLAINANCTYTSNGRAWPNLLQIGTTVSITVTFASAVTTIGSLYVSASSVGQIQTINSNTLEILGNITLDVHLAGTTQVNFIGTGTFNSANGTNSEIRTKFNINTTGTLTRGLSGYFYSGPELKWTQGTLVNGSTNLGLSFGGSTSAVISNGVNWGNVYIFQSTTTLNDDMNIQNLTFSNNSGVLNGNNLRINGDITLASGAQILTGTTVLQIIGSGSQTWTSAGSARISTSVIINKPSGTLNLSGTINFGGTLLSRTLGAVSPGSSTFVIASGTNTTINDMTFWNLTIPGSSNLTQNVANTINNNLTLGGIGSVTFAGTAGWTCANLVCTTAGTNISFINGPIFSTTTNANLIGTTGSRITMASSNVSLRATWTLSSNATQKIIYVNGTRMDSSAAQTIWSYTGTLNDTRNWLPRGYTTTSGHTFVS